MRIISLALAFLAASSAAAAGAGHFLPGSQYDPEAPKFEEVLGYAAGERISHPRDIHRWFEALAEAYPDRIRLVPYATSWEGRDLFYAVIGTPERIADLDAIRADIRTIAQPGQHASSEVEQALARVPATVWIAASVHGNEISPADGAMVTAWHLLAARDDELVDSVLANTLVFINPMQNPDGRARFVHGFEMAEGLEPAASRLAAEYDEPWPSGRVNHYLFDLNRDWLAITQPETQGHVEALLDWYPLAFVDAHEMGSDSTFFFAPEALPYNPLLADGQRESLALFGRNNARWFDRFGFPYFTRDIFDAFYPGYGASWPSYYGGVAMTYEQGSANGLVMRLRDGREMTYADTVREYFVAMLATIQTVSENRDKLWRDFVEYRRAGSELARSEGPRAWVIPAQRDQGGADRLAGLLARHGADVYRTGQTVNACGRELGAGSYVVPATQPAYRKLRVLMDRDIGMDAAFVAEQERRRAKDLPDEIYDVTAWSLPLMFNVETLECSRAVAIENMARVGPGETPAGRVASPDGAVAFLVPGGSRATARMLAAALRRGLEVHSNEDPFTHAGRSYPAGTLIFPTAPNPDDVATVLDQIARDTGAAITGVDSSWITAGPSFGSEKVRRLVTPRVALAWDTPTDVYSPGAVRFVLERQIGFPVVPIRTSTLARADLNRFDVVIMADESRWRGGGYADVLGERGRDNLAEWVENGGVLVTMAGATEWAAHPDVDLLSARAEYQLREDSDEDGNGNGNGNGNDDADEARVPGTLIETAEEFDQAAQPDNENPDPVAGVLVRAVVDQDHWLASGVAETVHVLVRGDRVFQPIKRDQGANVVRFAAADELVTAGHLWDQNRRQLAYKPFVVVQPKARGMVIGFTEDPAVRAYLDGLNMLLVNAVLRAPSYSEKLR
ncbi:MAG: M14 family zinc carboxypeptidase [Wenzhouxiangellaceae bacterium]|nr:M14 family zinc carboxypeptidase [Wenzhouxiangellaceae bacterium]